MQPILTGRQYDVTIRYLKEILPAKSEFHKNPTLENAGKFIELIHPWFIGVLVAYKEHGAEITRLRGENNTLEGTVRQLLAKDAQGDDMLAQAEVALHDLEDIEARVEEGVREKLESVRISIREELTKQYAANEQIFVEQINSLTTQIAQKDSQYKELGGRYAALKKFRDELKTTSAELNGQLKTAEADAHRLQAEAEQLRMQIKKYEETDVQSHSLIETMKTRGEELGRLQQMLASREGELNTMERELKQLEQEVRPLKRIIEAFGEDGLKMVTEGLPEKLRGLESMVREEFLADQRQDFVQVGHSLLDPALGNGIPKGSTLLVLGTQYTGMEWIAYEFAASAMMAGAPVLYITTTMNEEVLRKNLKTALNKRHQLSLIEQMERDQGISIYDANSDAVDLRDISARVNSFLALNSKKGNNVPRIIIDTYRYQVRALQEKDMQKQSESIYKLRDEIMQAGAVMLCTVGSGTYAQQTLADLRRAFACEAEFFLGDAGGKTTGKVTVMATWMEKPVSVTYTKAPDGIVKTALDHVK